jgi:CheY-like chemotaxis protein
VTTAEPSAPEQRRQRSADRRRVARGGRREGDRPGRHPTILIADSYAEVRELFATYLDRFGFHVETASNGAEAVSAIQRASPLLILMEPALPASPAIDLEKQLAADLQHAAIPIILLVGDLSDPEVATPPFRPAGVLHKPFQLTALIAGLASAAAAATLLNFFHPFDAAATDLAVHVFAVAIVIGANRALSGRLLAANFSRRDVTRARVRSN